MLLERSPQIEALLAGICADLGLDAKSAAAVLAVLPDRTPALPPTAQHPTIAAATRTMSMRRRIGFHAGRVAADRAQTLLGLEPRPAPIGPDGAPMWQPGITGSISHTDTLVCAIAMIDPPDQPGRSSIGIDLEQRGRIGADLVSTIMTEAEQLAWQALDAETAADRATAAFSLKEALYKAQYPLTRSWLGFDHIEVETALAEDGSYRATLVETPSSPLDPRIGRPLLGRGMTLEDHVVSIVALQKTQEF